ncbi:MAG: ribonuclease activity regulator RraA [Candidatus Latescibacteria bacterium]|nr:ribonuclease activity regulator RraA [Candidatus Latescibacterota bacterium]
MNPIEVSQQTLDQLLVPSTATLTSVLKGHGLHNTFMHGVAPLKPDMKMAGPAFTLRYIPAREDLNAGEVDNLTDVQRVGIEQISRGDVLVIDARGDTSAGTMGNILATRVFVRGGVGLVTDGSYRDSPAIAEIGLTAYAGAMNAHTNKTIHYPSEIQVPIGCGGVAVIPGDIVVGDGEGVVAIPRRLAGEVADKAMQMEEKEDFILDKIRNGASIVGTYPPDEKTLAEFEAWKAKKRQ